MPVKQFASLPFDHSAAVAEIATYENFLKQHTELEESKDILPFFRKNIQLLTHIPHLFGMEPPDTYAFEYDLFGDFRCDLVIGNHSSQEWLFIEFEAAKQDSLFNKRASKYMPEFGRAFEHGYSQIIDWFYALTHSSPQTMQQRFGSTQITFHGLLVVGRDQFLDTSQQHRLKWRNKHVVVNSSAIKCYTYDELFQALKSKISLYQSIRQIT